MLHVIYLFSKSNSSVTAWKVSNYGVISGPYFLVFGLNIKKYGPEITPYLGTFYAVILLSILVSMTETKLI